MRDLPEDIGTWIQGARWYRGEGGPLALTAAWDVSALLGAAEAPAAEVSGSDAFVGADAEGGTSDSNARVADGMPPADAAAGGVLTDAVVAGGVLPADAPPVTEGGERMLWLVVSGDGLAYNVPLIISGAEVPTGVTPVGTWDTLNAFDATDHPAGQRAILRLATTPVTLALGGATLSGHPAQDGMFRPARARRLASEQSNTSIIYTPSSGPRMIIKLFRVLTEGANPDVELTRALSGSGTVPTQFGAARLTQDGRVPADVLAAAEFLEGARDAWQVLTASLPTSTGVLSEADNASLEELGALTRRFHTALASAFPTRPATEQDRTRLRASWDARARAAAQHAPALTPYLERIAAIFDEARRAPWPNLQRIHGDYHLGQVVDVPERGWFALDFEGEPLRPLAERRRPDLALRDVAGMLRSFDYAGGQGERDGGAPETMRAWTQAASSAFLRGYGEIPAAYQPLLRALILDKALYEITYEAVSRPTWLNIPLTGLRRTLEPASPQTEAATAAPLTEGELMSNYVEVDPNVLDAVSNGWYYAPHDVLGPHSNGETVTIRTIRRLADQVWIKTKEGLTEAVHEFNGVWRAVLPTSEVPDYRVVARYGEHEDVSDDPYRFLPTLGEMDIYLIGEGRHEELWKVLGAHVFHYPSELGTVTGTAFSVWAPDAKAVRVVGDFNGWDGSLDAMRSLGSSGLWELFVPGALAGARYKFEIQYQDLSWHQKADPMARSSELPPATASIVTESHYEWGDEDWLETRRDVQDGPISIYEMHLGSWRPGLDYRQLADQLIGHIKYLGFTHVEFMPLSEHPYTPSWGYQVTGYYAPTTRYGSPDDLRYLVDRLHQAGIGVIMDWVPAHFATDDWALANFDGQPLYEDPNPKRGSQPDWGTLVFNYGRREVKNFLVANALYWLEEFHLDGIRVDAVASMLYLDYSRENGEWEPNVYGGRENLEAITFLQEVNATAYRRNPGILMIAEESTSWPGVTDMTDAGGLGFGLKWNMGWMNDTLHYLEEKPVNRSWHHGEITFSMVYAYSENFLLPISHDEVVHGKGSLYTKMPGDDWQKLAGVRELFAYQWAHPGKQLIFMGQEFAQVGEWNESDGLEWWRTDEPTHDGVMSLVCRLNEVYLSHPALWSDDFTPHGFEWIDGSDADNNVLTFLRRSKNDDDVVVVAVNFAGIPHNDYRVGFPEPGRWDEILNTDAVEYGGSGVGNLGAVETEAVAWNGREQSAQIQLPPFGVVYFARHAE